MLTDRIIELQEANAALIHVLEAVGGPFITNPLHDGFCRHCDQLVGVYSNVLIAHKPGCAIALALVAIRDAKAEPAVSGS